MNRLAWLWIIVAAFLLSVPRPATAAPPRVLPEGTQPDDRRLGPLKDLDGYFPFDVPESAEGWNERREEVRRQVLVANGLWPMPPRLPIDATVHGTVDREGYTVSRVYFESAPGLYVTGSLYRPKGDSDAKRPAVLCPHGHWANGRFFNHGDALKKELETGAEKFEAGGNSPLQARCVQLARMGCVVFHYDMLGYADSVPLTQALAHGFAKQRPELSGLERWGLFSAQSESRLINALGLQTWNGIRALDWVASLPDVEPNRIAVTGASGGGTQTFLLSAVDDRVAAAFPAVMVSTAMQGGCTCENASYLRVGTGNIELAGLTAPRPLGMTGANDWTREIETKGLPELKRLYKLLGVPDRVEGRYFDFPHNYNAVSRHLMYEFLNTHLQLGQKTPIEEHDYVPLTQAELTVWNDEHPKPASDEAAEVALLRSLDEQSNEQLMKFTPHDAASLNEYRKIVGGAYDVMIGRSLEDVGELTVTHGSRKPGNETFGWHIGCVRTTAHGEEVPAVVLMPNDWNKRVVVWPHSEGKAALFDENGEPIAAVGKLVDAGFAVATADLIGQGEFMPDGKPVTQSRVVDNPREFAGYTLGYNHPLFAKRVHDLLSLIAFSKHQGAEEIILIGSGEAAAWCAAACVQSDGAVTRVALAPGDFRFDTITEIRDPNLLPGAVKYGDLAGLLALCAPAEMWVAVEDEDTLKLTTAAYAAASKEDGITVSETDDVVAGAVNWLVGE
ncbi:MAG: acetylxylan esterase [Planctomycetaceae bacterium]